ncbi:hypothetical protein CFN16_21865 [Pseudomonas fluorescens]|uniref:Uncharacterized protein n=1 Tax=Pseudomonas fluorescens TaxID=294 RepID=A0A345V1S4_PSEFL|nr:hypothetical protein [Pseudomonas fluorescens]AXJ06676.1 hypothetical protein CFN16_21865 [Pseudomonas fluorescens]WJK08774.1 hypothetical protein QR290_23570 [Pseudomonas fluorescens]
MLKINKKIPNPITVIAIFAFISETSAAVSLPFLDNNEREIYVWFLISFPFYLLFLFFITLNFNYRSLYAPSDFDNDKNFLKAFTEEDTFPTETVPNSPNVESQSIKLPKPLTRVYIIDIRKIQTHSGLELLLEKIPHSNKHSPRLFLFLTEAVSDVLLKENIEILAKQTRRSHGTTFCIVYDTHSLTTSVLGKFERG